jgi:hypothetical protein
MSNFSVILSHLTYTYKISVNNNEISRNNSSAYANEVIDHIITEGLSILTCAEASIM